MTGTACLSSILRPVGWNAWQPYPRWVSDGSNQNIWVFGGASVIVGNETNVNSRGGAAWLDDASMNVRLEEKSNLMSPPVGSVEVERPVVMRKQQGDCVKPNPEYEGCDES